MDKVKEWIEGRYVKKSSARHNKRRFQTFVEATKTTPNQIYDMTNKDLKVLIIKFVKIMQEKGSKINSILAYITSVRAFRDFHEKPLGKIPNLPSQEKATIDHVFKTEELRKMWHVANTRDKALLGTACSLGWGIQAVLDMDKEYFSKLIKNAEQNENDFVTFDYTRKKTGANIYGILNPCAIDSMKRWLAQNKHKTMWNLTADGVNKMLRRLAEESGIIPTGRIRFHAIRAWLMSELTVQGLVEFEVKLVIGKKIPYSDRTYLERLKQEIITKYKAIYPKLSLVSFSNHEVKYRSLSDDVLALAETLQMMIDKKKTYKNIVVPDSRTGEPRYSGKPQVTSPIPEEIEERLQNIIKRLKT